MPLCNSNCGVAIWLSSHVFVSAHCCIVVTCWKRADFLAHVGDVYCIFVTFPCGILGQVRYLIVSFPPDHCHLSYFYSAYFVKSTPPRPFSVSFKYFAGMLQTY